MSVCAKCRLIVHVSTAVALFVDDCEFFEVHVLRLELKFGVCVVL